MEMMIQALKKAMNDLEQDARQNRYQHSELFQDLMNDLQRRCQSYENLNRHICDWDNLTTDEWKNFKNSLFAELIEQSEETRLLMDLMGVHASADRMSVEDPKNDIETKEFYLHRLKVLDRLATKLGLKEEFDEWMKRLKQGFIDKTINLN